MWSFLKKHYHWVIAAMALLQLLIYGGAVNNFSGYHMIPVSEALGISRTAFSLSNSVRAVMGVVSTLFSGTLIHRYGYRKMAAIGLCVGGLAYAVYMSMNSYWMLVIGAVLNGSANGMCATAAASRLLNSWFRKYRGTVLGLVTAATGVGSTLLGFPQTWAIENVSWRLSFGIVAGLMMLMALLMFLLVRNEPKEMGLRPFGDGEAVEKAKVKNLRWEGFSMAQLKKCPSYYFMILCAFLSCVCVLGTQYNFVPYMQDCGMSATQTSRIYGTMMLVMGFVKLGMGALCDAIGPKKVVLISQGACAAGLVLVMVLPKTDGAMIAALLVYDLAVPVTTMMFPLLSVDLFGYQAQSQYIGTIMAMTSAGSIVAAPMVNAVRDAVGSYEPAFWATAIVATAMLGVYLLLFAVVSRDRKRMEVAQKV